MTTSIRPAVTPTYTRPTVSAAVTAAPVAAPAVAPAVVAAPSASADAFARSKSFVQAAMTGAPVSETKTGLLARGLEAARKAVAAKFPAPVSAMGVTAQEENQTLWDKVKQAGKAAKFYALPVGAAAGIAATMGWFLWPGFLGGGVVGAALAAIGVGHSTGFLLHAGMRAGWVTRKEDRAANSTGVVVGSAALGAAIAGAIGLAAGASVGLPLLAAGAAIGAAPRVLEWVLSR